MQREIQTLPGGGRSLRPAFHLRKTLKAMNLNQQGCVSAVSSPAKFHYYGQLFFIFVKGTMCTNENAKERLSDPLASTLVLTGYRPGERLAFLQRTPLPAPSVGWGEWKRLRSEEHQTGDAQIGARRLQR